MRDLHNNLDHAACVMPQTIVNSGSPEELVGAQIDLLGFDSAQIYAFMGDIDELGGSPVGGAQMEVRLEHADDNGSDAPGTFANVALADVLGPSAVTSGIVLTATNDQRIVDCGYVGDKRWLRVTLVPTGLTNGGPACAWVIRGHPRHAPQ